SHLDERRVFPPSGDFSSRAHVRSMADYEALAELARRDPDAFWSERARSLVWAKTWERVLGESKAPFVRWFVGGRLNLAVNCLERHLAARGDRRASVGGGEPGDGRELTYRELHREVCRAANALASIGVRTGDRVAVYMPMVPELAIALLACARVGATHSVIFG